MDALVGAGSEENKPTESHHRIALFGIILKHLAVAERQYKLRRVRESFRYTFGLTMAMVEKNDWWWRTEVPTERLNGCLLRLATLWSLILTETILDLGVLKPTQDAVISKLRQVKRYFQWATAGSEIPLEFPFPTFPENVDSRERDGGEDNKTADTSQKRKREVENNEKDASHQQTIPVGTAGFKLWCDAFDPKSVQRGAWQLRCELVPESYVDGLKQHSDINTTALHSYRQTAPSKQTILTRIVIVSGSYTMFALNKAIAQAFNWGVAVFEHHVNKGRCPSDSRFLVSRKIELTAGKKKGKGAATAAAAASERKGHVMCRNIIISSRKNSGTDGKPLPFINDRKVKVCHIFRNAGEHCNYICEGKRIVVTCDGFLSDKSKSRNKQPLPRCVGYIGQENDLRKDLMEASLLNDQYSGERAGVVLMVSEHGKERLVELTKNSMKRPLFDKEGNLMIGPEYMNKSIETAWARTLRREVDGTA